MMLAREREPWTAPLWREAYNLNILAAVASFYYSVLPPAGLWSYHYTYGHAWYRVIPSSRPPPPDDIGFDLPPSPFMYVTRRTPHHGALLGSSNMSAWWVKTRRSPSRHCRDARGSIEGPTTTYGHANIRPAMHDIEYTPPPPATLSRPSPTLGFKRRYYT